MVNNNILFVRRTNGFGGCEIILLDWLRNIDYSKCHVSILTTFDFLSCNIDKELQPIRIIFQNPGFDLKIITLYKWFCILRKIRPNKIIYMQGHFFEIPLFILIMGFVFTKGNGYMTEHTVAPKPPVKSSKYHFKYIAGIGLWWYTTIFKIRLRYLFVKNIFAVSKSVKKSIVDWGYPEKKIKILRHGIDTNIFCPSKKERIEMRLKNNIPSNAIVIISTSRLSTDKNPFRLINLYNHLSEKENNLWLIIIGEGTLSDNIFENIKYKQRVKIFGKLKRDEVAKYLKFSDIFILPSDVEGFGIALIEAMATGLICIAIKGSGPDEIIKNGINGFLAESEFEKYVYEVKEVLALDNIRKKTIAYNAIKTVVEHYQLNNLIKEIFKDFGIPHK